MNSRKLIFVCDSQDYHAMDWFHIVKNLSPNHEIIVVTDIVNACNEVSLISEDDKIIQLFNIQSLLFAKKSKFGDFWRNFIKLIVTPIQIYGLRKLAKKYPQTIFHAHSMYYIFLCWAAKLKFIATPMGSDVLVRPGESKFYKYLTIRSLKAAKVITVDSVNLHNKVYELCRSDSSIVQNGINVEEIATFVSKEIERNLIVSIRGLYPNYQILELLLRRNASQNENHLTFVYPFYEENYREEVRKHFIIGDNDVGRLSKTELYEILGKTLLVVSIPISDSSPRSVYEAIFCGCCVAVTYSGWIDILPQCMTQRIIIVDLNDKDWFDNAVEKAKIITKEKFVPSEDAIRSFDQKESMKNVCREIYKMNQ